MIAVSIAYGHHARTLAVYVVASTVLWLIITAAAVVRAWLLDNPSEDVLGEVERGEYASLQRGLARAGGPGGDR